MSQSPQIMLVGAAIIGASIAWHLAPADARSNPATTTAHLLFARVKAMLADAEDELEHYSIGHRPMPAGSFRASGRASGRPGLYIGGMHSGIRLAPAVGLFVADEILTGGRNPLPGAYGPARFAVVTPNG
jgi:glycine/D-amino acid oxidase-like deaminating enzyme